MRQKIIIFFLILFIFILGVSSVLRTRRGSTDFDTYYYAAKRVTTGSAVYLEQEKVSPYIYPPFFACLIVPLTVFNIETASAIWYVLNLILFALCLLLCFSLIFNSTRASSIFKSFPPIPKILFLIITGILFLDNISMLQVNILVFFLILLGLYLFKRKKDILAGLFLALAISIKIIPVLFLIYFLIKREFKICASIVAGLLIFSIAIPSLYLGLDNASRSIIIWAENVLFKTLSAVPSYEMLDNMFNPGNQSITAFFSRWLIKNDGNILWWKRINYKYPPFMFNWTLSLAKETTLYISKIVVILLAGITFISCFKRIKDKSNPILNYEYSLILLLSLLLSPILRTRYFIFTIFPLLTLLFYINNLKSEDYRFLHLSFAGFAFLYLSLGIKIFKIFGFGTLSVLWPWCFILISYRRFLKSFKKIPVNPA